MKEFIFQWHLSEACNLKCKHCYQEDHNPVQLKYSELIKILSQYRELLKKLKIHGHINLTGGEPLCCPYFFRLLDEFKKDKELYTFSVLTNGTLITDDMAKKLSEYSPKYIQVSLEGSKKVNDYVRGKGVYEKVKKAIKHLKKYNMHVSLSFTATSLNYKEFSKVVKFAEKNKVDTVWSDRFIPLGGEYDNEFLMQTEQTQKYLKIMQTEHIRLKSKNSKTNVTLHRALQFQVADNMPYSCSAGITLLTVMENGDLVPCRRMPIVVGNLLKDNMYNLYMTNKVLKMLKSDTIPDNCKGCSEESLCKGGLKCLTYAIYKDLNHKDIGCIY